MKTAEEWMPAKNVCEVSIDWIKAIQLDAYKQGMKDAAEIGSNTTQVLRAKTINAGEHDASLSAIIYGFDMAVSAQNQAILSTAEKVKEI